ncbi:MAG: hypothetical protein ACYDCO_22330 [Armatimonadota bacterium]
MAKRNADIASSPAVWERLLGVLVWAMQGCVWSVYINIWALPAGIVLFLLMRKRQPFLARLSGRLVVWSLILNASHLVVIVTGVLKGMAANKMVALLTNNLPTLVKSPALISNYWQVYDPQTKAVMALLLGALALNVLVSLYGIGVALLGRPRQPRVESAPVPEAV